MAECPVLLQLQKRKKEKHIPKVAVKNRRPQTSGSTFDIISCVLLQRKVLKSVYYCVSYYNTRINKTTRQTSVCNGHVYTGCPKKCIHIIIPGLIRRHARRLYAMDMYIQSVPRNVYTRLIFRIIMCIHLFGIHCIMH
jgi:hypothetical protein